MIRNSDGESTVLDVNYFPLIGARTRAHRRRFTPKSSLLKACVYQLETPPEFVLNLTKIVTEIKSSTGPSYTARLPLNWELVVLPRDCKYVQLRPDEAYEKYGITGTTVHQLVEKRS